MYVSPHTHTVMESASSEQPASPEESRNLASMGSRGNSASCRPSGSEEHKCQKSSKFPQKSPRFPHTSRGNSASWRPNGSERCTCQNSSRFPQKRPRFPHKYRGNSASCKRVFCLTSRRQRGCRVDVKRKEASLDEKRHLFVKRDLSSH